MSKEQESCIAKICQALGGDKEIPPWTRVATLKTERDEALKKVERLRDECKNADHLCKWLLQSDISEADRERVILENGINFALAVRASQDLKP